MLEAVPPSPPEGIDYDMLFKIARFHKIAAMIYPWLPTESVPKPVLQAWKHHMDNAIRTEALFRIEAVGIYQMLEQKAVDYLPLKGEMWRKIYGNRIREFADVDLLIHDQDEDTVSAAMKDCGYSEQREFVHNVYTKAPFYNFEVHKRLFQQKNKGHLWAKDLWNRTVLVEPQKHHFRMRDEDYVLYEFLHMQKHFSDAGIGLRQLADFWLLNQLYSTQYPTVMQSAIEQMTAYGCNSFYEEMCSVTKSIFEKNEELPLEWMHFLYRSGCYGSRKNLIDSQIRENGFVSFLLQVLFPSFEQMTDRFPILHRRKWLLPLLYVVRMISFIFRSETRRLISYIWFSANDEKKNKKA